MIVKIAFVAPLMRGLATGAQWLMKTPGVGRAVAGAGSAIGTTALNMKDPGAMGLRGAAVSGLMGGAMPFANKLMPSTAVKSFQAVNRRTMAIPTAPKWNLPNQM